MQGTDSSIRALANRYPWFQGYVFDVLSGIDPALDQRLRAFDFSWLAYKKQGMRRSWPQELLGQK
jgi:hypothetical protein